MISIPPPRMRHRILAALKRLGRLARHTVVKRPDGLLIFAGDGLSFLEKGLMAMWGRALGLRVVLAPRSGMLIDDLCGKSALRRVLWSILLRAPNVVACQSSSWADAFIRKAGVRSERICVIPNGVTVRSLPVNLEAGQRSDSYTVLYLGWLEAFKGPTYLASAFLELWASHPELRLVFCGDGSERSVLEELLSEPMASGRVVFAGWVGGETKRRAFFEADCLVLPSLREGAPNSLIEAMAVGLPVIATEVGAIPEILGFGRRGVLVPPGDPRALAVAIKGLLLNRVASRNVASEARKHVLATHDSEVTSKQWVGLFTTQPQL